MKRYLIRLLRLILGLFLCAVGIVFTMKANLGYAPWEVFHSGISNVIDMQIGTITILTGAVIIVLALILGEKIGIGTILNMVLIGFFMNIILGFNLIPEVNNLFLRVSFIILGLFILALGSYFYMGAEFGTGPRDCLMVALTKRTKLPVGICRGAIEVLVTIIGYLLGGSLGIGTVISAISVGFCIQIVFKLLKFDVTKLKHEDLMFMVKKFFYKEKTINN